MNLTSDPIPQLVRKIAVPAATGMMFTTLFNITDTWFAGMLSTEALAALSLSFPVFFIVISAGVGLGQGTTALVSNALGSGDSEAAVCVWVQSIYISLFISVLVALVGLLGLEPVLSILTTDPKLIDLTSDYLRPLLFFGVFFMAAQCCNSLLVSQGDSKSNRNSLVAGFFANIALNPLLMFGFGPLPGFGVIGIAFATVIVQAGQIAYLLLKIRQCGIVSRCENPWSVKPELMLALTKQVLPASVSMLAIGTGLFVITHFIGRFGADAVAAYGIGMRIEQLAMLPMIGLGIACLTLVGQNLGAGKIDRVRETIRFCIITASLMMAGGAVLVALFKLPIIKLFSDDPEVLEIGSEYLFVAVLIFNAYAILHVCTSVLQGLKKPVAAMIVGMSRHVIAPPIVLTFTAATFGLSGIFWSIFAMSWLGAAMIAVWLFAELTKINRDQAALHAAGE